MNQLNNNFELRPCYVNNCGEEIKAVFHRFTVYGDAIVEYEDGKCETVSPHQIHFISETKCKDCGMSYGGDEWIDTVISNDQWKLIFPELDGILCANCIIKRAAKLGFTFAKMKLINGTSTIS
jgi:hypothetical protein